MIYSSLRGLWAAALAPAALILLGSAALQGGFRWFPALLLAGGVALILIGLYDLPHRTRFDHQGVARICTLREHLIPWEQIVAIERAPASTGDRLRSLQERERVAVAAGGLVARGRGRSRYLLSDRAESRQEYDRLLPVVDATPTVLRASPPRDGTPPTDLYRRRRRRA